MSININDVSFRVNENRWLEIWVGDQKIVSVDTIAGGVSLCEEDDEIGNIVETHYGTFEFESAPEQKLGQEGTFQVVYVQPVFDRILAALERIKKKL